MLIGAALIAGMLIWSRGRTALMEKYASRFSDARQRPDRSSIAGCASRVPGTAVFLSPECRPRSADPRAPRRAQPLAARERHPAHRRAGCRSGGCRPSVALAADGAGRRFLPAHRLVRLHGGAPSCSRCCRQAAQAAGIPSRRGRHDLLCRARDDRGAAMRRPSAAFPRRSFPTSTATPFTKTDATGCPWIRSSRSVHRFAYEAAHGVNRAS